MSKSSEPVTPANNPNPTCRKCWDKGYASYYATYSWTGDFPGDPSGRREEYKNIYCTCDKGRAMAEAALEALSNNNGSGNDKLPQPSLPVESLEATVIDCLDSARKGDDPNALGYYLMGEIDKALQKARKDELEKIVGEAVSAIYQSDDGVGWAVPAGTIYDRLKELRDE